MSHLKIIADDKIPFLKGVLEPFAEVIYLPGAKITAEDVKDANALFTRTRTFCNEALLKNSRIQLITTATIGYDHIDTAYCDAAGIRWINAPGCNSWSVQQYITTTLATLAFKQNLKFSELTLGIIGVGHVGSKVEQAAKALGMHVLLNDPPRADREGGEAFISLEQLLKESDIVTCHTPLTKEPPYPTWHLASDDFFNRMKNGAVFINSSRGAVVDSEALKRAISAVLHPLTPFKGGGVTPYPFIGRVYILDVWEGEPLPDAALLAGAWIATPHIAGYSSDGKANGTAACVHEFCDFFGIDDLKNWYPESIPQPPMPTDFSLDGTGKSHEQIVYEAVTHTYPIWNDSDRLKNSPETFEEQRGNYWIRREFKNFTIRPANIPANTLDALQKIGLKISD